MNKKKLGLAGAIVLTLVGTIALVAFVRSAEDRALADQAITEVLVLTQPVPAGTPTEQLAEFVESKRLPVAARAAGAASELAEVSGLVTSVDLFVGEQLTTGRLVAAEDYAETGPVEIPEGMLEVTVSLDPTRTVGNTIRPGDLVALAGSFTVPDGGETTGVMLHKVLVTNVQGEEVPEAAPEDPAAGVAGDRAPAPSGGLLVTFAVDASQFQKVVFAGEYGSIWLAREPSLAPEINPGVQRMDGIYG